MKKVTFTVYWSTFFHCGIKFCLPFSASCFCSLSFTQESAEKEDLLRETHQQEIDSLNQLHTETLYKKDADHFQKRLVGKNTSPFLSGFSLAHKCSRLNSKPWKGDVNIFFERAGGGGGGSLELHRWMHALSVWEPTHTVSSGTCYS